LDPDPNTISQSFWWLLTHDFNLVKAGVLFLLLFCSALISGAEVAFFGLSPLEISQLKETKKQRSEWVLMILQKPKRLLATILIANNAVNIGIVLLFSHLGDVFLSGTDLLVWGFIDLKFLIEVVLVTFLILMFGEILPKVYANRNRLPFALAMALPLRVIDVVFRPLSVPMQQLSLRLHEKLGRQKSSLSVDYLSQALELTQEGDTTQAEQKILEGIVSFGNTDTKQVMSPRIDVFSLSEDMKFLEVLEAIKNHGYSRVPVYRENIDQIIGILYIKDLLSYLDRKMFNCKTLLRAPYFVPENKKLDDLLAEFQQKKIHLAIVVDEFGGTSGVVTLEDIIEEIVGDISDEFDEEDLEFTQLDPQNFLFEGKTTLKDFYKVAQVDDPSAFEAQKGESETLAGFVLEISKSFPKIGEVIRFEGFSFRVEAMDRKRLKQIKATLPYAV
jgi:putative hemolysin